MIHLIVSLIAVVPALSITYEALSMGPNILFAWHPTCMSIAWLILSVHGIYINRRYPTTKYLIPKGKDSQQRLHSILMGLAFFLGLVGFWTIYQNKNNAGKAHFTSWHGKLGLTSQVLVVFQVILGLGSYYKWARPSNISVLKARKFHALYGILQAIVTALALIWGVQSDWFIGKFSTAYQVMTICVILAAYFLAVYQIYQRYLQKREATSSEHLKKMLNLIQNFYIFLKVALL